MHRNGSGQGMLHGPCKSPGIEGTHSSQAWPPLEHRMWGPWGYPTAPLRAQGSGRLHHAAFRLPGAGSPRCRLAILPTTAGPRHGVSPRLQHPWEDEGGRSLGCQPAAGSWVPLCCPGGTAAHRGGITPDPGKEGPGPAMLCVSRCLPQPRPVPRCHRRCFAASLREDEAGTAGSRSPAGSLRYRCRRGESRRGCGSRCCRGPRRPLPGAVHMGTPGRGPSHRCGRAHTGWAEPLLHWGDWGASEHGCSALPKTQGWPIHNSPSIAASP